MTVKNVLIALFALFALCSCEKDYHKLQKERVEQYKKEGKWIIAQSDSTSNEHYIIYGDKKTQTIGIDTLGGDVQVVDLKKPMKQSLFTPVWGGGVFDMFPDGYGQEKNLLKVMTEGFENMYQYAREKSRKSSFVRAYKSKYVIVCFDNDYPVVYRFILFLSNPVKLYYFGTQLMADMETSNWMADFGVDESNGDITCVFEWDDSPVELEKTYHCLYKVVLDCDGNIKSKDDTLLINGDKVPVYVYTTGNYEYL